MVRALVYRRGRRVRSGGHEPVCLSCLPDRAGMATSPDGKTSAHTFGFRLSPQPCETCQRPVIVVEDARRKIVTCSDLCRSRQYRRPVTDDVTRLCEGCGDEMTGRGDRRYCSSACRQRAYRRRARLVALGIPQEDARRVDTFGQLSHDAFEDVLRRARADGDLSAEHVAALAEDVLRQP